MASLVERGRDNWRNLIALGLTTATVGSAVFLQRRGPGQEEIQRALISRNPIVDILENLPLEEYAAFLGGKATLAGISISGQQQPQTVEAITGACSEVSQLPWGATRFQEFPRLWQEGKYSHIDVGWFGPDVDQIVALDWPGKIQLGGWKVKNADPRYGTRETRIVALVRANLNYVQLRQPLGGDWFAIHWPSTGLPRNRQDQIIDTEARCHAERSGRPWQDVYYVGDLKISLEQFGRNEPNLVHLIQCIDPAMPALGLESCFGEAGYSRDWRSNLPLLQNNN